MILTTVTLLIGFAILLPICIITGNGAIEVITISVGVTFYHFAMLIDSAFVILQRYNRPKLIKVMKRFNKIK